MSGKVEEVDPISLLVVTGAGLGAWWMHRSYRAARRQLAAGSGYCEDADIAFHVAVHEARSRRHDWLSPLHLLYGMLQDERVTAAIRAVGVEPEALEDRVLGALDTHESTFEHGQQGGAVLGYARAIAAASGRLPDCTDLWAALGHVPAAVAVLDAAAVDRVAVLVRLFHGEEPATGERLTGELDVVVRNDHYTTKEFVCEVLEQVFALPPATAVALMESVHQRGEAVVGRFRAAEARAKVADVQRRARTAGHPLWIGVVPA